MDGRGSPRNRRRTAAVPPAPARDGKVPTAKERGAVTKRRIAEAALVLLEENATPTTKEISERAKVSHRLLFHHYKDFDALLAAVAEIQIERYRRDVAAVPPHLALRERVTRTVRHRASLYESMGHLGSNVSALSSRVRAVAEGAAHCHDILASRLEHTFREEVDAAGRRGREVLGAIDAAVSWHLWDYLRRVSRLSPAATRRVMVKLLEAAVADLD